MSGDYPDRDEWLKRRREPKVKYGRALPGWFRSRPVGDLPYTTEKGQYRNPVKAAIKRQKEAEREEARKRATAQANRNRSERSRAHERTG